MHCRQHIADIPVILRHKGVEKIVISPGSRNAPIINAFLSVFGNNCISIIDERSAAYFAMGIALYTGRPVVLLCTSGTAVLNYAPAIAEAFHQAVPLIALTADRPPEWIDQQDNQTIRQENIYASNIKASYSLPVEIHHEADLWYVHRMINEAYNIAVTGRKGPVHINIPVREPIYEKLPEAGDVKIISLKHSNGFFDDTGQYKNIWQSAESILIVAGQQPYQPRLEEILRTVEDKKRICIIGEPASNIHTDSLISNPELILSLNENIHELDPELLIYFGGQVVSNQLKKFLRSANPRFSWFIDPAGRHIDTFGKLTDVIVSSAEEFFRTIAPVKTDKEMDYYGRWQSKAVVIQNIIRENINLSVFSDLAVISRLARKLSDERILFAGNSSVIRYLGMFPPSCRKIFSNRGTSGIDGCLSTAAGIAMSTDKTVIALLGDQSFVYDSNALWNRLLPHNLKIIVINNKGGGIFRLIPGPLSTPAFKDYLEAYHAVGIMKICEAFNVSFFTSENFDSLEQQFDELVNCNNTAVLEIVTDADRNPEVFRNFMNQIKHAL